MKTIPKIILFILIVFTIGFFSLKYINQKYVTQPLVFENTEWLEWNYFDFGKGNKNLENFADNIVSKLSDEQLAGMVLMPALEKHSDINNFAELFKKYHLGGYMVLGREVRSTEQNLINKNINSDLPVLVAVDAEPSLLKNRLPGLSFKNETQNLNSDKKINYSVNRISKYLKQKSVNINFAPVYDNGKNKVVIGDRAFSTDNEIVKQRAQLFANITYENNIFPTAKHFPGHGNVIGDTHKILSTINGEMEELENFKHAIDNNIPIIMVGHLAVENNKKWNTNGKPATLSRNIMIDLLRNDLSFDGIIITDAMNMGALNNFDHVELQALKSGADIVLMPRNIHSAYSDILREIKNNPEFKIALLEKVQRIVKMRYVIKSSHIVTNKKSA
ncbi:MAG: hypothetical protein LR005_00020 [Candidatus Pacebacteria bacterium]|nr:hypothetical protein [Candidatus Paceibacterota bacterium]